MENFKYTVGDIDEVIDERGNSVALLRKLAWGDNKEKLELRKWIVDVEKEVPNKGFTFLTPEGPHKLVNVMVGLGFGHTEDVLNKLKTRDDFKKSLVKVIGKQAIKTAENTEAAAEYYDPKTMLGEDE